MTGAVRKERLAGPRFAAVHASALRFVLAHGAGHGCSGPINGQRLEARKEHLMMSDLYTINDERTVYCRAAMKANDGVWNPVTREWMFHDPNDHANAAAELYRVTRPSAAMREALQAMIADGTAALAWGFDPAEQSTSIDDLDRNEASKLLAAGYAVRRVLGVHPLDDIPKRDDEPAPFDASEFETRARAGRRRRRPGA